MENGPGHRTAFTPFRRSDAGKSAGPGAAGAVVASVIPPETCRYISNAVSRLRAARKSLDELFQALDQVDINFKIQQIIANEWQIEMNESDQILVQELYREATGVNAISISRHDPSATIRVCNMQAEWLIRIAAQLHTACNIDKPKPSF
jgi:hypothetical protein